MDEETEATLFELADLVMALSRQLQARKDPQMHGGTFWTPLEVAVMRFIDRNPGTTIGAAAEATQLISSNFSRALRGLEGKGLIRRERDLGDARRQHLYPTELAQDNLRRLRTTWSEFLAGAVDPDAARDAVVLLRGVETALNRPK